MMLAGGRSIGYLEVGDGGAKLSATIGCHDVARAGAVAAAADDIQQQQGDFDRAIKRDRAQGQRGGLVAGDADAHCGLAVSAFSAQPHIGGEMIQIQRAAAVDDHG